MALSPEDQKRLDALDASRTPHLSDRRRINSDRHSRREAIVLGLAALIGVVGSVAAAQCARDTVDIANKRLLAIPKVPLR